MSTYTDASLIYYPSGYKASKAYSLKPTDGSGDLTFTRASTATRVNESGLIEEVATGVPRIDFTGAGCGSLILEPQATNLATDSEPTNTGAFKTGVVFQTTSIYGWNGMYYGDNSVRRVAFFSATTVVGVKYCFSFFVKMTDGSIPSVGATSSNDFQIYISSVTSENLTITEIGGGVYRVSITRTATSISSTLAVEKTTSMSAKTFEISGLQLEVSNVLPSSYIPTTGVAVTRVADVFSKTGISGLLSNTALTLFLDFTYTGFLGTTYEMVQIGDGSSSNRVQIAMNSSNILQTFVFSGGVQQGAIYSSSAFSVGDRIKIAVTYDASSIKYFLNGTLVYTSGAITTPTGLTQLMGGFSTATTFTFFNQLHSLLVAPIKLSDAELIALTTI